MKKIFILLIVVSFFISSKLCAQPYGQSTWTGKPTPSYSDYIGSSMISVTFSSFVAYGYSKPYFMGGVFYTDRNIAYDLEFDYYVTDDIIACKPFVGIFTTNFYPVRLFLNLRYACYPDYPCATWKLTGTLY